MLYAKWQGSSLAWPMEWYTLQWMTTSHKLLMQSLQRPTLAVSSILFDKLKGLNKSFLPTGELWC